MAKREGKPQEKGSVSTGRAGYDVTTYLLLLIPLAAVLKVAQLFVVVTTPDLLPLWAAVVAGLLVGSAVTFVMCAEDFTEFVPAGVLLVLTFILLPVFAKEKENRLRLNHPAVSIQAQAPTKTP